MCCTWPQKAARKIVAFCQVSCRRLLGQVNTSDQVVLCDDCGIGGIVSFQGLAEIRKMVIVWGFSSDARPMPAQE